MFNFLLELQLIFTVWRGWVFKGTFTMEGPVMALRQSMSQEWNARFEQLEKSIAVPTGPPVTESTRLQHTLSPTPEDTYMPVLVPVTYPRL